MHNNEWSLIFFTLISQISVGVLLAFSVVYFLSPTSNDNFNVWWRSPEIIILVMLGVAALISMIHLGKPIQAPLAMNNIQNSWISREIISFGILFVLVLTVFILRQLFLSPIWLIKIMLIISSWVGIVFIFSMFHIYMIETVPVWNHWFTPFSFFSTATLFLLFSLDVMNAVEYSPWKDIFSNQFIISLCIAFLIVILIFNLLHQFRLSGMNYTGIEQLSFIGGLYFTLFVIRIILLLIGIIVFSYAYFVMNKIEFSNQYKLILLLLFIIEEFIGRFMFYQSYFRVGV